VTPLEAFYERFNATATIEYAPTDDLAKVQEIAEKSEIVFIFIGIKSGEGRDRKTLALPEE
jgi:hypothetical protein